MCCCNCCPKCRDKVKFSHMFFNVAVYRCEICEIEYSWQELVEEDYDVNTKESN